MEDLSRKNHELSKEVKALRKRVRELEHSGADRRLTEETLRESEERLRLLSDNLPNGMVYQIDAGEDGSSRTFTYVSAGVERLHGITPDEAKKDSAAVYGQVHDEDRLLLAVREAEAMATMSTFRTEFRVRMPSGETRWRLVTSSPRRLAGNRVVWDGMEIDITDRKRAEEALQESEEKYRSIFENSIMGIFRTTPDGRYLSANPAGIKMWGYGSLEEMMQSVTDLAHQTYVYPKDRERFKELVEKDGSVEGFEAEFYTRDGNKIWASMNARAMRDATGKTLYYETTFENITKRKKAEEEREKLIIELQRALAEVKILSGMLPICAWCKKIRDDKGYWTQIEAYLKEHSEAEFSHSICPDCMKKVYPRGKDPK